MIIVVSDIRACIYLLITVITLGSSDVKSVLIIKIIGFTEKLKKKVLLFCSRLCENDT